MSSAPFTVSERVRWADVDLVGIMRYDVWLPRKVLQIEYHAPARLDDLLAVRAWIGHIGTSSLKLEFQITDAGSGDARASAHFFLVCVGRGDLKKRPLPSEVVLLLRPYATGE